MAQNQGAPSTGPDGEEKKPDEGEAPDFGGESKSKYGGGAASRMLAGAAKQLVGTDVVLGAVGEAHGILHFKNGCLDGWGGSCCDVQLLSPLSGLVGQMQASVGVWVSALPALLAAAALLRFGLRQRHRAAALELRLEDRLAHLRRALIRDDERSERT